jgi:L-threonylcarbamoyladenylate synthase
VIAYPTESVWGLGCDPFNPNAVARILKLKQRSLQKGLILIASDIEQLGALVEGWSLPQRRKLICVDDIQPTTWLVPHRGFLPDWITGQHATVALRVSSHPLVKSLCQGFGGMIVSTSANRAGLPAARNEVSARHYFGSRIDTYVAGATGGYNNPSRIVDFETGTQLR